MIPDKKTIEEAHKRISAYIHRTPILKSSSLNQMAGCEMFFKCENFQNIGAFKARGAMNAALLLSPEERSKGVATHSSGNHGQAVARAANILGMKAYIVMPHTASEIKKSGVLGYGGEVHLCEPTLQAREATLLEVVKRTGASVIHPFNDYAVIAGQATVAKEMLEDVNNLDVLVSPVGGGGLLSGTSLAAKYFSPSTSVIGAEPAAVDDAFRSMQTGKIEPSGSSSIADGLLTSLGDKTFDIIRKEVKEIITVTEEEIIAAMRQVWERLKIVIEPSSAVTLAVVMKQKEKFHGKRIGVILSGGNVDLDKIGKLFTAG
jgi:threonine dehydratase